MDSPDAHQTYWNQSRFLMQTYFFYSHRSKKTIYRPAAASATASLYSSTLRLALVGIPLRQDLHDKAEDKRWSLQIAAYSATRWPYTPIYCTDDGKLYTSRTLRRSTTLRRHWSPSLDIVQISVQNDDHHTYCGPYIHREDSQTPVCVVNEWPIRDYCYDAYACFQNIRLFFSF